MENNIKLEKGNSRIIRNAIKCLNCGEVIESNNTEKVNTCRCGSCTITGGHIYFGRTSEDTPLLSYVDESIVKECAIVKNTLTPTDYFIIKEEDIIKELIKLYFEKITYPTNSNYIFTTQSNIVFEIHKTITDDEKFRKLVKYIKNNKHYTFGQNGNRRVIIIETTKEVIYKSLVEVYFETYNYYLTNLVIDNQDILPDNILKGNKSGLLLNILNYFRNTKELKQEAIGTLSLSVDEYKQLILKLEDAIANHEFLKNTHLEEIEGEEEIEEKSIDNVNTLNVHLAEEYLDKLKHSPFDNKNQVYTLNLTNKEYKELLLII